MGGDGTYQEVPVFETYAFDCLDCGGQTALGDVNPNSGDLVECADCGSTFEVA